MNKIVTRLGQVRKMVNRLKLHSDDTEITFEFMLSFLFPSVWNSIQEEIKRQHTLGFIEGKKDSLEEKKETYPIGMTGMIDNYEKIYKNLLEIKKIIYMNSYSLDDAGFHGWYGDPLKELIKTNNYFDNQIDNLIYNCQYILGKDINPKAYETILNLKGNKNGQDNS